MGGIKDWPWLPAGIAAALALILAALALRPPAALPAAAPANQFSAARAWPDVLAIAQRPHPIGSPAQEPVRAYLLGRMTALGLSPQIQPLAGGGYNLVGRLPTAAPRPGAVLLMAHYDSVPAGPGAADDAAGVAAVLEVARALKASGALKRDVRVLLTDGEESHLRGSQAFFASDAGRQDIVINLEARGDRGRAAMFETQPRAGGMIAMLVRASALSGASSLMPDLYRRLPNDTDLTWAIRRDRSGLNFAFFGGLAAYHQPGDTVANLDPRSLQSIGQQVLAAARTFAQATALPAPSRMVYGDVMGGPILAYRPWAGWVLLGLAVGFTACAAHRSLRLKTASLRGLAGGGLAFAGLILALAAGFWLLGAARIAAGGHRLAPLLRHETLAAAALGLLAAGIGLGWLALARTRLTADSLRLGAMATGLGLGLAVQAIAPLDAFILTWPLLLGALATLAPRLTPLLALAAAAQLLYWGGLMFALIGQVSPVGLSPFAALTLLSLLSLAPTPGRTTPKAALAVISLAMIAGFAALAA